MLKDSVKFERAISRFDSVHREDPETVLSQGSQIPRACLYHERLSHWVDHLDEDASEPLRLAAHCQHLRRWMIPRADYPEGLKGYRRWRRALADFHVQEASSILREAGYGDATIGQVQEFLTKKNLKHDPGMQLFEDAICLVFFEIELADFAGKYSREKSLRTLRKIWLKMSEHGREVAQQVAKQLPTELHDVFYEAIKQVE